MFVLFVFICYALVAFGMAMNLKSNLTHATAEGARAAVGAGLCDVNDADPAVAAACVTTKRDAAIARTKEAVAGQSQEVRNEVDTLLADPNNVVIAACDGAAASQCITVTLPYDYGAHPIVPSAPGLGVVMPSTLNAESIVQLTN